MKIRRLWTPSKLWLGVDDIARLLGISRDSAKVFCSRHVKSGELVRLRRNSYMLRERWEHLTQEQRFMVGNLLQVPSYISLMTALSYYELTTQMQQDFIESIARYRTKEVSIDQTVYRYTKIAPPRYGGFVRQQGYFIATPEKAFIDCLYLASLHRYHLDWTSLAIERFQRKKIQHILRGYPAATQQLLRARWSS